MATDAKNIWLMILGGIVIAFLGGLLTVGIQKLMVPSTANAPAIAQVLSVQPHYVTKSVPYESCRQVAHTAYVQPQSANVAGTLIGGVAGGALGNQIGEGRGRAAATIGGALLGAFAGNQVEQNMNQPQPYTSYSTACRTRYATKKIQQGYEVTYLYNGQQAMVVMPTAPMTNTIPMPIVNTVPVSQ